MRSRLRSMMRYFRYAAFWFYSLMVFLCLALFVASKDHTFRVTRTYPRAFHFVRVDRGLVSHFCYFKPDAPENRVYREESWSVESSRSYGSWRDILYPHETARRAWGNTGRQVWDCWDVDSAGNVTKWQKEKISYGVPLLAFVNLFAIWAAVHLWWLWRRKRRASTG